MKRRDFLKALPVLFAGLYSTKSIASNLEPKSVVGYQDHPKDGHMCRMCIFFIPPNNMDMSNMRLRRYSNMHMMGMMNMMHGKCKVVAGNISPMGWCKLFKEAES